MARESSTSRHRNASHARKHERRNERSSRERSVKKTPTNSEGTSSASSGQRLSLNALAQLDQYNARHPVEDEATKERERRKKKRERPPVKEYKAVRKDRSESRRRDGHTDDEREGRRERRRRQAYTDDEREAREARRKSRRRDTDTEDERDVRRGHTRRKSAYVGEGTDVESPTIDRRRGVSVSEEAGAAHVAEERYQDSPPPKSKKERQKLIDVGDDGASSILKQLARKKRKKSRLVSGAVVEEGRAAPAIRGGAGSQSSSYDTLGKENEYSDKTRPPANRKKRKWIIAGICLVLLIIIIVVAVTVSKKYQFHSSGTSSSSDGDDVPMAAKGTYLDPSTWVTTTDFNTTYTNETVGGLPIEGLYTDWDDSTQANDKVPALNKDWGDYASTPARGVNLGGWLSIEPFITPSLFNYDSSLGIIDEWTLCSHLGDKTAASTIEEHYATFVTEDTFKEIQAAGLDHVRIPYSYWAVQTYDDDPYVFRTSWRYLLRGIEWARKYGLRVNLDLHGLPGSQNGWNHSGHQGIVGWLNSTNGDLNAQRSLDIHGRLSQFFAQDRYKNIITFYGLANEPRMVSLDTQKVLDWTTSAYNLVRKNGITAYVVFGDGFMGLENWQGKLQGLDGLVLDVHQYEIFNNEQIVYNHTEKVNYACEGWTQQTEQSLDTATGFGPTMFAEWSQADTDCANYLNNVGWGNRWTGTYDSGNVSTQALTPMCPLESSECSCDGANADSSDYSDEYKTFLQMFAEAQMTSFEKGWGWWYWTWDTESATQWSYKQGMAAGILPTNARSKSFSCASDVPDFKGAGLSEAY